jgi:hypothetical protein
MGILQNEQVQAALVALIVVGLNALAQWVRSKVSYTKIVDDYWCYIQPVAEAVRGEVLDALKASTLSTSVLGAILQRALAQFADSFRLNEGKQPTATQIAAVKNELIVVAAVAERSIDGKMPTIDAIKAQQAK